MLAVDTAKEKMEWLAVLRENIAVASGKKLPTSARCAYMQQLKRSMYCIFSFAC